MIFTCLYKTVPYKTVQYKTVRKNIAKYKKTVPYKTVPKIVQQIVQKTVPLIEVIIVLEADKQIYLILNTFWYQLIRITIGSIVENLKQPR